MRKKKYLTPKVVRSIEVASDSILLANSPFDPDGEGIEFGGEGGDEEIVQSKKGNLFWSSNE